MPAAHRRLHISSSLATHCGGLLLAAAAAAAAEGSGHDLRLLLGTYADYDQVSDVRSDQAKRPPSLIRDGIGRAVELEFVYTPHPERPVSVYGLSGIAVRLARGEDDTGRRHHVFSGGLLLGGGISTHPLPHLTIELGPTVTVGYTDNQGDQGDDDGDGIPNDQEAGYKPPPERSTLYLAADARVGIWWTLQHLQIGAVAGAAAQTRSSHREFTVGGTTEDIDYTGTGTFVMVGIGRRF